MPKGKKGFQVGHEPFRGSVGRIAYPLSDEQQERAILLYGEYGNFSSVADGLRMDRQYLVRAMQGNKEFAARMEEAKETYADTIRQIYDAAVKGRIDVKSPRALLIMHHAKSVMPEYRDKSTQKMEGKIELISGVPRPPKRRSVESV